MDSQDLPRLERVPELRKAVLVAVRRHNEATPWDPVTIKGYVIKAIAAQLAREGIKIK